MAKGEHRPHVRIVRTVTRKHAEIFAEAWYQRSIRLQALCEAVDATGIMTSPKYEEESKRAALVRYFDLVDEILDRTLEAARGAVADAFLKVAQDVLARERATQRRERAKVHRTQA